MIICYLVNEGVSVVLFNDIVENLQYRIRGLPFMTCYHNDKMVLDTATAIQTMESI